MNLQLPVFLQVQEKKLKNKQLYKLKIKSLSFLDRLFILENLLKNYFKALDAIVLYIISEALTVNSLPA